ncbi:MAG: transposase [Nitrospirota bacterium]
MSKIQIRAFFKFCRVRINARTFLFVIYRTVKCRWCGNVVEDLGLMDPCKRVTRRLATYILELCQYMTITEVAEHLGLDLKTVKEIHKQHLIEKFSPEDIGYPRVLAVDEISLKKRHHYLTLIINWEVGRVLWVGEGRKYETLNAAIVFDQFHVVKAFGKVIDKVRNTEYRKATRESKNEALTIVYILKDYLKKLWQYKYPKCAESFLNYWCSIAVESKIRPVIAFAKTLRRYAYGIINHCRFPIHTSRMEGINNKIKVIKRKAYGFHDIEYFSLIIKNVFAYSN